MFDGASAAFAVPDYDNVKIWQASYGNIFTIRDRFAVEGPFSAAKRSLSEATAVAIYRPVVELHLKTVRFVVVKPHAAIAVAVESPGRVSVRKVLDFVVTDGVRYDTGPDGAFYHAMITHVREADKSGNIITYRQEPDGKLIKTGVIEKVDPQVGLLRVLVLPGEGSCALACPSVFRRAACAVCVLMC